MPLTLLGILIAVLLVVSGQTPPAPTAEADRVLRDRPVFRALRDLDPETYNAIGKLVTADPSADQYNGKAWDYLQQRFGAYVLASTDGAIIRFYQNVVRLLDQMAAKAPVCDVLNGGFVESATTPQQRDALVASMENLIANAHRDKVVFLQVAPEHAPRYLDNIVNKVATLPRDVEIIKAEKVAPADRERRCQLDAAIIKEVTRQPLHIAADLLRLLASRHVTIKREP